MGPSLAISFALALVACLAAEETARAQIAAGARATSERLVIIPFRNASGTADDVWIGDGIAETLTTDFQAAAGFDVVGPELVSDAMRAMGIADGVPGDDTIELELGRRVGARWLVAGGYQRIGDQVRLTGRLMEVPTWMIVRSVKIDGAIDELFDLQDRLAAQLVAGTATRRPPDRNPDAPPGSPPRPGAPLPREAGSRTEAAAPSDPPVRPTAPGPDPSVPTSPPPLGGGGNGNGGSGEVSVPSVTTARAAALLNLIDGPPPPVPPAVMTRDAQGRTTIRAITLTESLRLDGRLDERVYHTVSPVTDFIQLLPEHGAPATERTEAWVMLDSRNVYVAARVWDSAPPSAWVADEMRRDTAQLRQNDTFSVVFDTFYDRRNGVSFYTNPLGAIADFAITNEGNPNSDWNPVWDVRTGRFEGGWTLEMEIPFKSLRYRPGPAQVWGVQMRRGVRRRNEWSYLTRLPILARGQAGILRVSGAATLVGIEAPGGSKNLEIKPYGVGGLTTDLAADPPKTEDADGDYGFDVKYGITQNLTADFTYNTDFAQVEVDEQQVNLTRFSLFFPEKREFFLEGRGIFEFARGGGGGTRGGALRQQGGGGFFGGVNTPTLFYTRRIGLEEGAIVPIIGGGRVTGKIGAFDVGTLNIQSDDEAVSGARSTNFTVVRVKRDILRRSSIGGIFTNRSVSLTGDGSNQAYGVDTTLSFYDNVNLLAYLAKTQTPGLRGRDTSYQGRFGYAGDRYGFEADHLLVEDNFVPEIGFVRRENFRRSYVSGRFSPRPRSIDAIRQFRLEGSVDYILAADTGQQETRQYQLGFQTEFESSDQLGVSVADNTEFLVEPFEPASGVTLPVGSYEFRDIEASYTLGAQHRINGTFLVRAGEYFSGDIRSIEFNQGRGGLTPQFSIEPSVSFNWVDLPEGTFTNELIRARVNYTFTPRMFFSGLMQYNSSTDSMSNNLRLRWEYSPGSELFVVYTEERDTEPLRPNRFSELSNRGLVIKINRLFRF